MQSGASDSLDYNLTLETQAKALRSDSLAFQVAEQLGLEKRKEPSLADEWLDSDRARLEQNAAAGRPLRFGGRHISRAFERALKVKPFPARA